MEFRILNRRVLNVVPFSTTFVIVSCRVACYIAFVIIVYRESISAIICYT